MYIQSTTKVKWNDSCSDSFQMLNGVNHSFNILYYIDGHLERIKQSCIGCHIYGCRIYSGYTAEFEWLGLSLSSLKRMIKTFE